MNNEIAKINQIEKMDNIKKIGQIGIAAVKTACEVYEKIAKAKTEVTKEQKEIHLELIDFKKAEMNALLDMYQNKELTDDQMERFKVEIREITNSVLELNNQYDKKLQKREENQNTIIKKCVEALTKLGVTGIITAGVVIAAKTFKK